MNFDILNLFKRQDFTERPTLVVPVHERVDTTDAQPVLMAAAELIVKSGLLSRWVSIDGSAKLVRWDTVERVFLRDSLSGWQTFFGQRWRVIDTNHQEFLGPSSVVADRLIQVVLAHPELPVATWAMQIARKREATK